MNHFYSIISLVLFVCFLSACDNAPEIDIDKTFADAKKKISDITPTSDEVSQAAEKEVQKLSTIEYRVHTLSFEDTPEDMQAQLAELGQKRWSCFHMERNKEELLVFCSRRPKSYLRHLSKLIPVPLHHE